MKVLAIAAHPDDEVLGAGATLARYRAQGAQIHVAIVTEGASAQYPGRADLIEAKKEAARHAIAALGGGQVHFGDLPDMQLDTLPLIRVNAFVEDVVRTVKPDLVLTHHHEDLNSDHRIVHEASVVACRASAAHCVSEVLAYDVLGVRDFAATRASFVPRVFVACEAFLQAKLAALRAYDIEVRPFPHPRSPEAIEAQGRVCGVLSGTAWAEAFDVVRICR